MDFARYEQMPQQLADKIISAYQEGQNKQANLKFCVGFEIHALKFYVGLAMRKGGHRLNSKFNLCPF